MWARMPAALPEEDRVERMPLLEHRAGRVVAACEQLGFLLCGVGDGQLVPDGIAALAKLDHVPMLDLELVLGRHFGVVRRRFRYLARCRPMVQVQGGKNGCRDTVRVTGGGNADVPVDVAADAESLAVGVPELQPVHHELHQAPHVTRMDDLVAPLEEVPFGLHSYGSAALMNRDYVAAAARYSASLAEFRAVGDRFGQANALRALGDVAQRQVRLVEARGLEEQSVRLARELENREGVTLALDILGAIAIDDGDLAVARTYFLESLVYRRDLGARARLADSLERFATLAEANGQSQCALRLGGAAAGLCTASGVTARPVWEREPDVTLGPSRDGAEAENAWVAGQGMSQDAAVAYALSLSEVEPSSSSSVMHQSAD
jgi:hypothetical protein